VFEVFGLPPHGWSRENFKNIAELWGSFVCLGQIIERAEFFESMKVLIDTGIFNTIEGEVLLQIENLGFKIKVREVGSFIKVTHKVHASTRASPMEVTDSNDGVVGFVDIDDEEAAKDEFHSNDHRDDVLVAEEEANGSVEKSPNFEFNGSNVDGSEQSGDKPCASINSVSRTNTVNFNQNGFSEEILKTTQPHLLDVEKIGKLQKNRFQLYKQ